MMAASPAGPMDWSYRPGPAGSTTAVSPLPKFTRPSPRCPLLALIDTPSPATVPPPTVSAAAGLKLHAPNTSAAAAIPSHTPRMINSLRKAPVTRPDGREESRRLLTVIPTSSERSAVELNISPGGKRSTFFVRILRGLKDVHETRRQPIHPGRGQPDDAAPRRRDRAPDDRCFDRRVIQLAEPIRPVGEGDACHLAFRPHLDQHPVIFAPLQPRVLQ